VQLLFAVIVDLWKVSGAHISVCIPRGAAVVAVAALIMYVMWPNINTRAPLESDLAKSANERICFNARACSTSTQCLQSVKNVQSFFSALQALLCYLGVDTVPRVQFESLTEIQFNLTPKAQFHNSRLTLNRGSTCFSILELERDNE